LAKLKKKYLHTKHVFWGKNTCFWGKKHYHKQNEMVLSPQLKTKTETKIGVKKIPPQISLFPIK